MGGGEAAGEKARSGEKGGGSPVKMSPSWSRADLSAEGFPKGKKGLHVLRHGSQGACVEKKKDRPQRDRKKSCRFSEPARRK